VVKEHRLLQTVDFWQCLHNMWRRVYVTVSPSVHPIFWPPHGRFVAVSLAGRRHQSIAARPVVSSSGGQCHIYSRCRMLNTGQSFCFSHNSTNTVWGVDLWGLKEPYISWGLGSPPRGKSTFLKSYFGILKLACCQYSQPYSPWGSSNTASNYESTLTTCLTL